MRGFSFFFLQKKKEVGGMVFPFAVSLGRVPSSRLPCSSRLTQPCVAVASNHLFLVQLSHNRGNGRACFKLMRTACFFVCPDSPTVKKNADVSCSLGADPVSRIFVCMCKYFFLALPQARREHTSILHARTPYARGIWARFCRWIPR